MLFQYIGYGKDSPEKTTVYGYTFELNGVPVDVVSENAVAKLKGNASFIFNPEGDTQEEIEATYAEMKEFIASKGIKLISLKKRDVKAQYDELKAA